MNEMAKNNEKKTNPILMFLFAVVIPLFIVIAIVIVILNFAGIDVIGWVKDKANEVPVLSSVVTTEEEAVVQQHEEQLKAKDEQIEELEQQTEELQATIEELERELLYYENSYESLEDTSEEEESEEGNEQRSQGTTASSFANMDSAQAAAILEEMPTEDTLIILQQVSNKVSGSILEAMNAETAAELAQRLLENEG